MKDRRSIRRCQRGFLLSLSLEMSVVIIFGEWSGKTNVEANMNIKQVKGGNNWKRQIKLVRKLPETQTFSIYEEVF